LRTPFTISRLRSSVSGGTLSRTTVPSTFGVMPISLLMRARSIADRTDRSQGWMTIRCGSGVLMPAIWLSGVGVP